MLGVPAVRRSISEPSCHYLSTEAMDEDLQAPREAREPRGGLPSAEYWYPFADPRETLGRLGDQTCSPRDPGPRDNLQPPVPHQWAHKKKRNKEVTMLQEDFDSSIALLD